MPTNNPGLHRSQRLAAIAVIAFEIRRCLNRLQAQIRAKDILPELHDLPAAQQDGLFREAIQQVAKDPAVRGW